MHVVVIVPDPFVRRFVCTTVCMDCIAVSWNSPSAEILHVRTIVFTTTTTDGGMKMDVWVGGHGYFFEQNSVTLQVLAFAMILELDQFFFFREAAGRESLPSLLPR